MPRWNDSVVLADSTSLTANTSVSADTADMRNPTVLVALEDLEGAADDTVTVSVVGDAATYEVDSRTLASTGAYIVDVPQGDRIELESSNGATYSAEARADPTG